MLTTRSRCWLFERLRRVALGLSFPVVASREIRLGKWVVLERNPVSLSPLWKVEAEVPAGCGLELDKKMKDRVPFPE